MKHTNPQQEAWQIDPQKYQEAAEAVFHREPKLTSRQDKGTEDMPGILSATASARDERFDHAGKRKGNERQQ